MDSSDTGRKTVGRVNRHSSDILAVRGGEDSIFIEITCE